MKLLCINTKTIEYIKNEIRVTSFCPELKEGETYTTKGKPFNNKYGKPCYYIEGLGQKLCCRFTELLEDDASEKALNSIKRELQLN